MGSLFSDKDPSMEHYRVLARNIALFAGSVYLFHKYGHKLAV